MKQLKIVLAFILAIGLISSCKDDSLSPVPFESVTTTYGGYVRELSITNGAFHIEDLAGSAFILKVQIYDGHKGENFESLDFYVSLKDNSDDNGTVEPAEAKVVSFAASQFTIDSESGYPVLDITITAQSAIAALGLTEAQIGGSDIFTFRQVLNMKDGNSYSVANTGLDVLAGPFYASPFENAVGVVCPSDIGGDIAYTTTVTSVGDGGDIDGCAGGVTGTVQFTPVAGSPGKYTVSDATFGQYDCAWGDTPAVGVTISDACGKVAVGGADQYALIYTFTIISNDGTELTIKWKNDYGDGGTSVLTRAGGWPLNLEFN